MVSTLTAIIDPHNDITLFKSGAIVSYLITTYDNRHIDVHFLPQDNLPAAVGLLSSLGPRPPYFGQADWFNLSHPEPLPSARERYNNEVKRVAYVLDSHLAGRSWPAGDKSTYADLAFVMWSNQIPFILKDAKEPWDPAKYTNFTRWQEAMLARDSVKHVLSVMADQEVKCSGRV